MNKKISNDENIKNLKKRKILRIIIIIFAILTIVLSILSLLYSVSIIFPILSFIITHLLMRIKERIIINKTDDLKEYRNVLNNSKK